MDDHRRYIVSENVERFESLLRTGHLERGQIDVVRALLAQARAELATLEPAPRAAFAAGVARHMPVEAALDGAASGAALRQTAASCAPSPFDRAHR